MTMALSEENFERKTTWAIVAIDSRDSHCDADPQSQRSGHGPRHGGVQTQKAALVTTVETDNDDGRSQGVEGNPAGASLRFDVCGSCHS